MGVSSGSQRVGGGGGGGRGAMVAGSKVIGLSKNIVSVDYGLFLIHYHTTVLS